jgi:hypothetical protein
MSKEETLALFLIQNLLDPGVSNQPAKLNFPRFCGQNQLPRASVGNRLTPMLVSVPVLI